MSYNLIGRRRSASFWCLRQSPGSAFPLVRAIIERQLDGSTKLSWGQNGFRAKLVVPTQENDIDLSL